MPVVSELHEFIELNLYNSLIYGSNEACCAVSAKREGAVFIDLCSPCLMQPKQASLDYVSILSGCEHEDATLLH